MADGKTKKGGQWKAIIEFDTEASGSGVIKRIAADDLLQTLENLIGSALSEQIQCVETYKTPLSQYQMTSLIMHHEFVVFQTSNYYWSIEKVGEGLIFQRSTSKDNVKLKRGRKSRLESSYWEVTLKQSTCNPSTRKNIRDFVTWLLRVDELNNTYYYLGENCQVFANRSYNYIKN